MLRIVLLKEMPFNLSSTFIVSFVKHRMHLFYQILVLPSNVRVGMGRKERKKGFAIIKDCKNILYCVQNI